MMSHFHETIYGRRFFDGQLPALIQAVMAVAEKLPKSKVDYRPCVIDEPDGEVTHRPARFHRWADVKHGSHFAAITMALLEDEDGEMRFVIPENVRFIDRKEAK